MKKLSLLIISFLIASMFATFASAIGGSCCDTFNNCFDISPPGDQNDAAACQTVGGTGTTGFCDTSLLVCNIQPCAAAPASFMTSAAEPAPCPFGTTCDSASLTCICNPFEGLPCVEPSSTTCTTNSDCPPGEFCDTSASVQNSYSSTSVVPSGTCQPGCKTASECPAPINECQQATCANEGGNNVLSYGTTGGALPLPGCGVANKPDGTACGPLGSPTTCQGGICSLPPQSNDPFTLTNLNFWIGNPNFQTLYTLGSLNGDGSGFTNLLLAPIDVGIYNPATKSYIASCSKQYTSSVLVTGTLSTNPCSLDVPVGTNYFVVTGPKIGVYRFPFNN